MVTGSTVLPIHSMASSAEPLLRAGCVASFLGHGWGILSTGHIAKVFAQSVLQSKTGRLAAVGSRQFPKARQFAKEFNIPHSYGSYQALLKDPSVQAVYIATPHPSHAEWAVKAAQAGKQIRCAREWIVVHDRRIVHEKRIPQVVQQDGERSKSTQRVEVNRGAFSGRSSHLRDCGSAFARHKLPSGEGNALRYSFG